MADDNLLAHEIECHQFTEPLDPAKIKQPGRLRRLAARATGRVWFRVGWTCPHLKAGLESAEAEMLLKGELADHLDIYQLQGGASASAGTHSLPGAADLGQTSDAQIDILRLNGVDGQRRTPAQGFILHCHGFAQGCNCGSRALLAQRQQWNNRQNGLVSHGPIQGRWPTKKWSTAVAERAKVIMGLKDDIISGVVAQIRKDYPAIAKAVWQTDDVIANDGFTGNADNKGVAGQTAIVQTNKHAVDGANALSAKLDAILAKLP